MGVLCACGAAGSGSLPQSGSAVPTLDATLWRIVDGADTGSLMLAEQGENAKDICSLAVGELPVTLDGKTATAADLKNGMLLRVSYDGALLETYPSQFSNPTAIHAKTEGFNDWCGLLLQVFDDLWNVDEGLNSDITLLGVDIDPALVPNAAERAALAWRFSELCQKELVTGTWQELVDQGYIDKENLYWEKGCLFTFRMNEGGTAAKPLFDAEKWRSGLGAYFFVDCTASQKQGVWSYQVGAEAIS